MRRLALLVGIALLVAACGGSRQDDEGAGAADAETELDASLAADALPAWMEPLLVVDGPDVALVYSTSDYGPGPNRLAFLVIDEEGALVQAATADVYVGAEGSADPVKTAATLNPLGPHSHPEGAAPHDHPDATDLYVATVDFPAPGRYWMVVQPAGQAIQGIGAVDVRGQTVSPPVGSPAIASDNPTLDDAPAEQITTASPPDTELLRYSIADSLADQVPFVAVFATPKFCQTRTCGPTVEVVEQVRENLANPTIRFIHVEIYENNDPQQGVNRWVDEWRLPTEPWVFLVGADGLIKAKFEGSVSVEELEHAVRATLL